MKTTIIILAILFSTSISSVKAENLSETNTSQQKITILQSSVGTQFTAKINLKYLANPDKELEITARELGFSCVIKEKSQIEIDNINKNYTYTIVGVFYNRRKCL